jgi:hypothetical protein
MSHTAILFLLSFVLGWLKDVCRRRRCVIDPGMDRVYFRSGKIQTRRRMKIPDDLFVRAGVLDAFKSDSGAISLMLNTYLGAVERRSPAGIEKDLWDGSNLLSHIEV